MGSGPAPSRVPKWDFDCLGPLDFATRRGRAAGPTELAPLTVEISDNLVSTWGFAGQV